MSQARPDTANAILLLVDDDPHNLDILSRLLRPSYTTRATISGALALQLAVTEPRPDLILLDVIMPEMDGFTVLARLRESQDTRDIPVIFVTGQDSLEDEERGLQLGAVDYITKPYRPSIIRARISTQLELKRARDRLAGQNAILEMEVARRTAELAAARDVAEAASRSKSAFINTMSHELRTPMNGVYGMIQLLQGELPEDDPLQEYLAVAHDSAKAMIDRLKVIMDYVSVAHGEIKLQYQPLSPAVLVRETALGFASSAAHKGLELAQAIDPAAPDELLGDPQRLRQVLSILVGNAIKFTAAGWVELGLEPGSEPGSVRFFVRDTGPGIAPEQQEGIFDAFTQADSSATRTHGGMGLGLALARSLVEHMGGSLRVDSAPGQGSRFRFDIPGFRGGTNAPDPDDLPGIRPRRA